MGYLTKNVLRPGDNDYANKFPMSHIKNKL